MTGRTYEQWHAADASRYPTPNACKFVGGDAFLKLAMQAWMAAGRRLVPPDGERWSLEGCSWANAEDFYQHLLDDLGERLRRAALARGDLAEVPWSGEEEEAIFQRLEGAGRSPAAEGHGCPASSAAVGPAPVTSPEAVDAATVPSLYITTPANPLFCGLEVQELPEGNPLPHSHETSEETPA